MKKLITVCALVLIGALVFAGGASETAAAGKAAKTYEIKLVTSNSSSDPTVKLFYKYAGVIKERTNGGVDIQVYPDGEILMGDEGIEAIMSDAAVITFNDLDVMQSYCPELGTLSASFLIPDHVVMEKFAKTDVFKEIMKKSDAANIHYIAADFLVGARSILAGGAEVRSVADCKKLNIRIPNVASYVAAFNAFGANYSAIGWSAGVSACETGMLNGAECTVFRAADSGLAQILKNPVFSLVKWRQAPVGLAIGTGYWNSLPEEYRNIITEELENCAHENNQIIADSEASYMEKLNSQGVKVIPYEEIDIASFQNAIEPINSKMPMFSEVFATVQKIIAEK